MQPSSDLPLFLSSQSLQEQRSPQLWNLLPLPVTLNRYLALRDGTVEISWGLRGLLNSAGAGALQPPFPPVILGIISGAETDWAIEMPVWGSTTLLPLLLH